MNLRPASNMVQVKGKWYVQVTVPKEIQSEFKGQKQLRRSTGTSEKRTALALRHSIETRIYAELDLAYSKLNPFKSAVENLLLVINKGPALYPEDSYIGTENIEEVLTDIREAAKQRMYGFDSSDEEDSILAEIERPKIEKALLEVEQQAQNATGAIPKLIPISDLAKRWLLKHSFGKVKTKDAAKRALDHFIDVMGDLFISDITKKVAYDFATALHPICAAKTIGNRISYLSQALTFAETEGLISSNPLFGMKLSGYGKPSQRYQPLTTSEMTSLFSLSMNAEDRLLLSILITTGMRLDEAALLCWEDLKTDKGIAFFDLTRKIVKTTGSKRMVPIPPSLALPKAGTGRLFSYKTDKDGKAQASASKALMPHIRKVTSDNSKVVHSLRGTLKDLLRDVGISSEINDFITGHGAGDVAGKYGVGPSLKTRLEALSRVAHPWLI
jgi:integrase